MSSCWALRRRLARSLMIQKSKRARSYIRISQSKKFAIILWMKYARRTIESCSDNGRDESDGVTQMILRRRMVCRSRSTLATCGLHETMSRKCSSWNHGTRSIWRPLLKMAIIACEHQITIAICEQVPLSWWLSRHEYATPRWVLRSDVKHLSTPLKQHLRRPLKILIGPNFAVTFPVSTSKPFSPASQHQLPLCPAITFQLDRSYIGTRVTLTPSKAYPRLLANLWCQLCRQILSVSTKAAPAWSKTRQVTPSPSQILSKLTLTFTGPSVNEGAARRAGKPFHVWRHRQLEWWNSGWRKGAAYLGWHESSCLDFPTRRQWQTINRSSELWGLHVKVLSSLSDRRTIRTVSGLLDSWKGIMWSDITVSFIHCLVSSRLLVVHEFWLDGMLEMVDFPS